MKSRTESLRILIEQAGVQVVCSCFPWGDLLNCRADHESLWNSTCDRLYWNGSKELL